MTKRERAERIDGGEFGPGWYDVSAMLLDLYRKVDSGVRCELEPVRGRDGQWGLRISVYSRATGAHLGACGYGRAYNDGAKTMAAACVHAFIKAERELADKRPSLASQELLPLDGSESEPLA